MTIEMSFEKVPFEKMDRILKRAVGLVENGCGCEGGLYARELENLREEVVKPLNKKFLDSVSYSFKLEPHEFGGALLKIDLLPILSDYEVFSQFYDTFRRECAGGQSGYIYDNTIRVREKLDVLLSLELGR